jgi:hypothetical protein
MNGSYRSNLARLAEMNCQIAYFRAGHSATMDLVTAANLATAARVLGWQLDAERSLRPAPLKIQAA